MSKPPKPAAPKTSVHPLPGLARRTVAMPHRSASRRMALLQGASAGALLLAAGPARAGALFPSINQALALARHAAPVTAPSAAGVTAAKQAQLGVQNLAAAAARFNALAQSLGRTRTAQGVTVPDGLAPGGLEVLTDNGAPVAYSGAQAPTQAHSGTVTDVTIKQTQALAQLAWKTFNVGAKTHLTFDQSAGGSKASSWITINSVLDPQANPSQILGSISAVGKVYLLNRNGIAFGAGSSVNVGSLVAATANIAQSQFGIDANDLATFNLYGAQSGASYAPTFVGGLATSAVTVAAGASIATPAATGTSRGGSVMLFGGDVANSGVIATPQGQTVLAAGTEFTLRPGSQGSTTAGNTTSTTLGNEVATLNVPVTKPGGTGTYFPGGTVANAGIVVADQGDISLVGHAIVQNGVLLSTSTVNTRGTIHLLTPTDPADPGTAGSGIALAPGSVTEIVPEDDGSTALDSQRAANIAASLTLNAQRVALAQPSASNPQLNDHNLLPDQFGESRIEISSGGTVDLQPGALAVTPGGQVAIGAATRVLLERGSTIDVSGSTNAVLPSSVNELLVNVQPYQLRDSAANRGGGLKSSNVYVDARTLVEIASGAYGPTASNPLGNIYTPGGLFEVGGYLGLVPHGIAEWTALGGQVTLQSQPQGADAGTGEVITQAGSVINLTGGTVTYQAGPLHQTYVQTDQGLIYNANNAPGNLVYNGIYTGQIVSHARWQVSEDFVNPLLTPATTMDPAYVVGRDAGTLTVSAATAVLQGSVPAGVTLGQNQTGARPASVSDPYLLAQNVVPRAGALQIGDYTSGSLLGAYASNIVFQAATGAIAPATIAAPLAPGVANTVQVDTRLLRDDGFASIAATTTGTVSVNSALGVSDGGSIALGGSTIAVNAPLTARGGSIALSNVLASTGIVLAPPAGASNFIALGHAAVLDARGVWTNAAQDPVHIAGEGLVNGGSVSIDGVGGVSLAAGSRIDVSSGGAILSGGKLLGGTGGSVTIVADLSPVAGAPLGQGAVSIGSTFAGYGSRGGGTLSLTAPIFLIGNGSKGNAASDVVALASNFFTSGFSHYAVDGTSGLAVLPGAQITVAEPVYELAGGLAVPTGGDPSSAYSIVLPPLFTPVRGGDTATKRAGASLSLESDIAPTVPNGGGAISIGTGASVSVDPGQFIVVAGHGQVTVSGTLTAHGGTVEVANTAYDALSTESGQTASAYVPGVSVWIANGALLDVSGTADIFTDPAGRSFGVVSSGGTILLGGYGGLSLPQSTWAQIIVRPGARLDADGASATLDVVAGNVPGGLVPQTEPLPVIGNGGTIVARSLAGLALDGVFSAAAGGPGGAGGSLVMRIDPTNLAAFNNIPAALYGPSQLLVSQNRVAVQPDILSPGEVTPDATFALGRISQQQITAGGFSQINLFGADFLTFDGNVALHAGQSITLGGGAIGTTTAGAHDSVAAPHVTLSGYNGDLANAPALNTAYTKSSLDVSADLLDLQDAILLGGTVSIVPPGDTGQDTAPQSVFGFSQANFTSSGDVRFLGASGPETALLESQGNLLFRAAQLYPVSGKTTVVYAGVNQAAQPGDNRLTGGIITVQRNGAVPAAPYSVGGVLGLVAATVSQDGIVRAPEGQIRLGYGAGDGTTLGIGDNATFTSAVTLGAGSVTSVSLVGQTIPYGGTLDGVNYLYPANTGGAVSVFDPTLEIDGQSFAVKHGATVDLRGGGTLSGAGFIAGRGGSADVLRTPLLDLTGGSAVALGLAQTGAVIPAGSGDPVYAILPGYRSNYAPSTGVADAGYSTPANGAQITVGANEVPGLAAGTYTLLPAYYALLPGGYRVELTGATLRAGSQVALGNFSVAAPVTTSIAQAGVASTVPMAAIFTDGAGIRQLSQYDEESYNAFETASGTQFGAPRPVLPQDAKTLVINYPVTPAKGSAFSFDPAALLQQTDTKLGGYGLTVEIASAAPIDIVGPKQPVDSGSVILSAAALSGLDAARLVIGGTVAVGSTAPNTAVVTGTSPGISVLQGAVLQAGDVLLTTNGSGTISVAPGATISTIGERAAAYDLASGFYFVNGQAGASSYPVLDVSNGQDLFLPNTTPVAGASITIGDGARLLAGGSLNFVAPLGTSVGIGTALLGAKYASIAVSDINIGTLPPGSDVALPTGLNLSDATLASLLNGNPALGTPAAIQLTLTATQEVNLLGNASLDTRSTALVLNTPAIYGYGNATQTASITAPSFTWNGVETQVQVLSPASPVSALPGGQIAGSQSAVTGSLVVSAGTIVLGYGPQTQADAQLQLDRLLEGFSNVTLAASKEITANNKSSLSVYASQPAYGEAGTGSNLTLVTPLLTTAAAAMLDVTVGGSFALVSPSGVQAPATTALGGQIGITAGAIAVDGTIGLASGRLGLTAQDDIIFGTAAHVDLSGRSVPLFDQVATTQGGTLAVESTAGSILQQAGASIDVSSPSHQAGSASFSALAGDVALDGTLRGASTQAASSGSISVIAGTLGNFDALNGTLDDGGFFGRRAFEIATGDIVVDATLRAHTVSLAADSGNVSIAALIDASGINPGSITVSAGHNLVLSAAGKLDAHATTTAVDSYGQAIDAENRAHVTLTAVAGTLALAGGSIDVSYPGQNAHSILHPNGDLQGELVLNAPRLDDTGAAGTTAGLTYGDVALAVSGTPQITGAQSIALYATGVYTPTDPLGTIGQDTGPLTPPGATVTLAQIDADSTAFIAGFAANGAQRIGGLAAYGSAFHVRPGAVIQSSAATGGDLTITGDLDFSALRYNARAGYGTPKTGVAGSGEPGSITFRAADQLVVNGSVSDGFAAPPGLQHKNYLTADAGWVILARQQSIDPLNADVILPSSISITQTSHGVTTITHQIELAGSEDTGTGTTFDIKRPISLNYDINIAAAVIYPNRLIPFAVTLGADSDPIPAGGWLATAPVTDANGHVLYAQGTVIPGGTILPAGTSLGRNSVLPVSVTTIDGTTVPQGTMLTLFSGDTLGDNFITLYANTGVLPANAFIPSNTAPIFITPDGRTVGKLNLRPADMIGKDAVQGLIYPLAALLPAGSQSWNMSFVAGANEAAADTASVLPKTVLSGGALAAVPNTANQVAGSLILDDQHDFHPSTSDFDVAPGFSVIRTGTGNLSLIAGGDFDQSSLYGIYTAGTQSSLGSKAADKPYNTDRSEQGNDPGDVLPGNSNDVAVLNRIIAKTYQAYYPNGGGDVLVSAQGNVTGDVLGKGNTSAASSPPSDGVGNWLWRQGGDGIRQLGAWWINYGTVVSVTDFLGSQALQLSGFQGIGALGGGNVSVIAGGDAGQMTFREGSNPGEPRGEGLVVAVGGTGRVLASGGIVLTGGGTETVQIGGTLNPLDPRAYNSAAFGDSLNGDFIDIRGNISITAGAVGRVETLYSAGTGNAYDPRSLDPFVPDYNSSTGFVTADGGPNVLPGDGTVQIDTMGDLVLGGAGDPGRVQEQSFTEISAKKLAGKHGNTGGQTGFTLWTDATSISLSAAGGNVTPTTQPLSGLALDGSLDLNDAATDYRFVYPATLLVTAATGSIVYGSEANPTYQSYGLETAPSPDGRVAFLAGASIYANGFAIDQSGASQQGLSTPFDPAYQVLRRKSSTLTNVRQGGGTNQSPLALFALEADTPTTNLHATDTAPSLFYAAGGDIVNLVSGQTITFPAAASEALQTWYLAAKPVRIMASGDIVSSGTRPTAAVQGNQQNQQVLPQYNNTGGSPVYASGDVFFGNSAQSVSVVSAGRDILSFYGYAGGSGLLEVDAGRNLFQGGFSLGPNQLLDFGSIKSVGPLIAGDTASSATGADIAVLAGIGTGPDYAAFAALYLDPDNQANLASPITDPANQGKVQQVYTTQLSAWLRANYPGLDLGAGAVHAFGTLPSVDQEIFLREVFFDETLAGGRQFNDPTSRFFGSYARGRTAIDALFPSAKDTQSQPGVPAGYTGAITMLSGPVGGLAGAGGSLTFDAGVQTSSYGGSVQVLDPGGQIVLGTAGGAAPGGSSGIITNGPGGISIFALDSVLLGQSRIFTQDGGNVLVWSAQGDINAGIGARTTIVYNPPVITYDTVGNLAETAAVATNGAGIATLAPLPGVPAGDVDLIAPLGTIDAGEAGIRVSGNLNLAAARLANTANISVGGKTTGNAAPVSISLGSVEAAGAAAGAAANAAQSTTSSRQAQETPSVIEVEVLGVSGSASDDDEKKKRRLN